MNSLITNLARVAFIGLVGGCRATSPTLSQAHLVQVSSAATVEEGLDNSYISFPENEQGLKVIVGCSAKRCDVTLSHEQYVAIEFADEEPLELFSAVCPEVGPCLSSPVSFVIKPRPSAPHKRGRPLPTASRTSFKGQLASFYGELSSYNAALQKCRDLKSEHSLEVKAEMSRLSAIVEAGKERFIHSNLPHFAPSLAAHRPPGPGLALVDGESSHASRLPTKQHTIRVEVGYNIEHDLRGSFFGRFKNSDDRIDFRRIGQAYTPEGIFNAHSVVQIFDKDGQSLDYISWGRKDSEETDRRVQEDAGVGADKIKRETFYITEEQFVEFHFWKLRSHLWFYEKSSFDVQWNKVKEVRAKIMDVVTSDPRYKESISRFLFVEDYNESNPIRDKSIAQRTEENHLSWTSRHFSEVLLKDEAFMNQLNRSLADGTFLTAGPIRIERLSQDSQHKLAELNSFYQAEYSAYQEMTKPLTSEARAQLERESQKLLEDLQKNIGMNSAQETRRWLAFHHRDLLSGKPIEGVKDGERLKVTYEQLVVNEIEQATTRQRYYQNGGLFSLGAQSCVDIAAISTGKLLGDDKFYRFALKKTPRGVTERVAAHFDPGSSGMAALLLRPISLVGSAVDAGMVAAGLLWEARFKRVPDAKAPLKGDSLALAGAQVGDGCVEAVIAEARDSYTAFFNQYLSVVKYHTALEYFAPILAP